MKRPLTLAVLVTAFTIAVGVLADGFGKGSHRDSANNGKDSPRFYASPHLHPDHP